MDKGMNNVFHMSFYDRKDVPLYNKNNGYGFIDKTSMSYQRSLSITDLYTSKEGICMNQGIDSMFWENVNHYDYGGMAFRVDLGLPGSYKIEIEIIPNLHPVMISISGMDAKRLIDNTPWDAAGLVTKNNNARWCQNTWSFEYVSGNGFVEVEIEPEFPTNQKPEFTSANIGIKSIRITPTFSTTPALSKDGIASSGKTGDIRANDKTTIITLGDSTVKSYIYEESIMSGWGQMFDELFDQSQVNVINYSMGGRSLANMYREGRFNEVLLRLKPGDFLLLQSGHNDESTGELNGLEARYGRGNSRETYIDWLTHFYIPAIKSRGINPIFVTPMTRVNMDKTEGKTIVFDGFANSKSPNKDFPSYMKEVAAIYNIPVIDLYEESMKYLKSIGSLATKAIFLSVEAGETPSKTNSGSFANGNPSGNCDGTHFKEALSKQWARIVAEGLVKLNLEPSKYLKEVVKEGIRTNDWSGVYPEIPKDTETGKGSYYRNQIEALIKRGILSKDEKGNFNPYDDMNEGNFIKALYSMWELPISGLSYKDVALTREVMASIIIDAYELKFGRKEDGTFVKPKYMTDYNGVNVSPEDVNYDPNLIGESAMYYPLVGWGALLDKEQIRLEYYDKCKTAYELGLIRSEDGILRGKVKNGLLLEPKKIVSREKAAKALYFLMTLPYDIKKENHRS